MQLYCRLHNRQGFTLIELLVTISIIGILLTLGLSVYSSVYKASRDAKRKSDLKLIQSALEQYRADQHHYPFEIIFGSPLTFGTKIYLVTLPRDPTADAEYSYAPIGTTCTALRAQNCTGYCLYAKLEGGVPPSDAGCNHTDPRYYGVSKP